VFAGLLAVVLMMVMAFVQNVSFSIVSRSRNRNSVAYHRIAAIFSNGVWYITAKYLIVTQHMSWLLFIPYTAATVYGSTTGQQISMWVERKLNLQADDHLKKV
jgi:putative flippase GtrA